MLCWVYLPVESVSFRGKNVDLFRCSISMISRPFTSFFCLKAHFQWVHHIPVITCDEGSECYLTRI